MSIEEIYQMIIAICKEFSASRVVLFGSRAKGTNLTKSDIDIAVSGVKDIDMLEERLDEIPTLYKIDLVDLDHCKNQFLMEDIAQYGREIYKKI